MSVQNLDIRRAETTDGVMAAAEKQVADRARKDAPKDYCDACIENTPMAYGNASDIGAIKAVEAIATDATIRIQAIERLDARPYWPENSLKDHYIEAYYEACADPADCEVCRNPDSYGDCGHDWHGLECPAR